LDPNLAKAVTLLTPHLGTDLKLDLRGSSLEVAVRRALQSIMATSQEVGAARAANRIAVALSCHRVVKSDGSIAGYR
jgi:AraC family transcriptional regulator of adaptative response/methylated-DNA-[protein]-cysteine methyltransferase